MKYFLHLCYAGAKYRGWQNQPNVISVQEVLETCLTRILKKGTTVYGCGRTDAGVNASQYFAHFEGPDEWSFDPVFILNKNLPDAISIIECIRVDEYCHARFDAKERSYDYFFHQGEIPFLNEQSSSFDLKALDIEKVKAALEIINGKHDFYYFCRKPEKHNHTVCWVMETNLYFNKKGNRMRFQIKANRFIRGMIRIISQTLIEVGLGNYSLEELTNTLNLVPTETILQMAPPDGLFLSKVHYPYLQRENIFLDEDYWVLA